LAGNRDTTGRTVGSQGPGGGGRRTINAATVAALWSLSSGYCYAPGCPSPVVVQVRPGVYRKNVQVAHIYGVRPNAPRHRPGMAVKERDTFANLLLLCRAHHDEIDDPRTGEQEYPPERLRGWKERHEGDNGPALAALGAVSEDALLGYLEKAFRPPLKRLDEITDRLEQTGTLNAEALTELRQVVDALQGGSGRFDWRLADSLSTSAELLGSRQFRRTVDMLSAAADQLPRRLRNLPRDY